MIILSKPIIYKCECKKDKTPFRFRNEKPNYRNFMQLMGCIKKKRSTQRMFPLNNFRSSAYWIS